MTKLITIRVTALEGKECSRCGCVIPMNSWATVMDKEWKCEECREMGNE